MMRWREQGGRWVLELQPFCSSLCRTNTTIKPLKKQLLSPLSIIILIII